MECSPIEHWPNSLSCHAKTHWNSSGKKCCARSSFAINPFPKEVDDGFIQNYRCLSMVDFPTIISSCSSFIGSYESHRIFQHPFNFSSCNNHLFNVNIRPNPTHLPNFWPQFGQESKTLFCILNLSSLK